MPSKQRSVAQRITVRNLGHGRRKIQLGFDLRAGVIYKRGASAFFPNSPGEPDNQITWLPAKGCLVFEARHSKACSVQGFSPRPDRIEAGRMLIFDVDLGPGESKQFRYCNAIAENGDSALGHFEEALKKFDELVQQNERDFNNLIEAAFTPGNTEFSGHLPQLFTKDESLWRLYYGGFSSLLFARRASPDSAYGTTYVTLGGRVLPTVSAPWDTSLTSLSLSLLDPAAVRRLVEAWFEGDIMHQHLCTDHVTGDGVGYWYAVNDMALVRCARDYLRVTGDLEWLDKKVNGGTVFDRLLGHALYWKKLDHRGVGLADYGKIENLLEVVSTYVHEVAGMNAGNVSSMRFMADIAESRGNIALASQLRTEAKKLAGRINRLLYVDGKGWWRCGQPDGSFNEVRHCYDVLSVFDNMFEDLSHRQKKEMSHFFWSELCTPLWMRALSPQDTDATWNIRPDHSCIGSYPGWPPMMAKGLYKTGNSSRLAKWVKGLAKATLQGPYGQAHFVESFFPPEHGGACKCPTDPPYLTDWSEVCGGCFTDLVIDTIFGAEFTLHQGIKTTPRLDDFDPAAQLVNVNYQGKGRILSKNV
jgi:hypothetical protein